MVEERNQISLEELTEKIDDLQKQIKKLWENLRCIMTYYHFYDTDFRDFTNDALKDETIIKRIKFKKEN